MRKLSVFLSGLFLFATIAAAQDTVSVYQWNVTSKNLGGGKYELVFKTTGSGNWQLYAPNQVFDEVKMAELVFADSSVVPEGVFTEAGTSEKITSQAFGKEALVYEGPVEWKRVIAIKGVVPATLQGTLNTFYGKGDVFNGDLPFIFNVPLEGGVATAWKSKVDAIDIKNPVNDCGDGDTKGKSLFTIFLLGMLGGLIALLTPCVFPMIPVTVTFFTKKSQDRKRALFNATMYGLFIFLIYVLITIPFHIFGARSEIFNNISTNVWLNLAFFVVFIVFALSFFGLFEITLPAGLANKADSRSGIGNLGGIFFMAGTLAIVSFSCTGPILGTLLVGVSDQGAWPLTAGAAGFGLALGLPFALFALFPNWLHSLPKSGGWMTTVKVVLGFVELALAVKFLANADNVEQWGILKREVFVAAWVIIGAVTTLYLLGIIRFHKEGPVKKFSAVRIFFILLFGAFTLYLIPGLTNTKWAGLKLLSGFPPPLSYSIYGNHVLHKKGVHPIVNDYTGALEKAKKENKPVLIDFTGWACVNCRRMEEKVWTKESVYTLLNEKFVVVSLYVDERRKLPLKDRFVDTVNGKPESIITIGDKWTSFQKQNFYAVSQPQYAILSPDQQALTRTKFYTPDADEFKEWLECGLEAYRKMKK